VFAQVPVKPGDGVSALHASWGIGSYTKKASGLRVPQPIFAITRRARAEANTFAAELLMPTCHVRERCEKSIPSLELVKAVADEFQVSLTAAGIRVIHLTKQECILVASKDRKVSWWVPKGDCFGVWLRQGQILSQDSLAWHAFDGSVGAAEVEDMPPDAWFPNRPAGIEFGVSEQSMLLTSYGVVLTILTLTTQRTISPSVRSSYGVTTAVLHALFRATLGVCLPIISPLS
jgi:hypothetical protein